MGKGRKVPFMTKEHPYILFVGGEARGRQIQAQAGRWDWPVHITSETMDALAAYIFFYPDVVVLDAGSDPETAREVFRHLDSIGAGPLLILVDEAQRQEWAGSAPPTARTRYLSPLLGGAAWAAAVQDLLAAGAARGEAEPALDGALARSG